MLKKSPGDSLQKLIRRLFISIYWTGIYKSRNLNVDVPFA